jgi:ribonucleoside-triphosphate reductase
MKEKEKCITEVWSRVTGFFRPVVDWNKGKKEEFKDRNSFKVDKEKTK